MNATALAPQNPGWNWIACLADTGWALIHDLIPDHLIKALHQTAQGFHAQDMLDRAGIGRAGDFQIDTGLRRDKTRWLAREDAAQIAYLDIMESVRREVNQALFLGLFSYEAHFAAYEKGGFYKRHLDAFKGRRNRVLSSVCYLNPDWQPDQGGDLAIYAKDASEDAEPIAIIPPEAGTVVLFLSEDIPHEVLPTPTDRYSIAGWFRVNDRQLAPGLQTVPDVGISLF